MSASGHTHLRVASTQQAQTVRHVMSTSRAQAPNMRDLQSGPASAGTVSKSRVWLPSPSTNMSSSSAGPARAVGVKGFKRYGGLWIWGLGNIFKKKVNSFHKQNKIKIKTSFKINSIQKVAKITLEVYSGFFFGQNSIEGVLQVGGIRSRAGDHQEADYHHSRAQAQHGQGCVSLVLLLE